MKKPKPPRIPRCLCSSFPYWLLQIASPSKCVNALFNPTAETVKYFRESEEYDTAAIEYKIEKRACTREEWHRYRRRMYYRGMKNHG